MSDVCEEQRDDELHAIYDRFVIASDKLEKAIDDGSRRYGGLVGSKARIENEMFMYIMDYYCKAEPLTLESSKEILKIYRRLEAGETITY